MLDFTGLRGPVDMIAAMRLLVVLVGLIALAASAAAADLAGVVRDGGGQPVADAVLYAVARTPLQSKASPRPVVVDEVNAQFTPFVTPVQLGAKVSFTNADTYAHNVYSVSETKVFSLPLSRQLSADIVADRAGVIVLGCNIHDWMVAYLLVVDTPYYAVTNANGASVLRGLVAGEYDVYVWHPGIGTGPNAPQRIAVSEGAIASVAFTISLRPDGLWRIDKANPIGRYQERASGG